MMPINRASPDRLTIDLNLNGVVDDRLRLSPGAAIVFVVGQDRDEH